MPSMSLTVAARRLSAPHTMAERAASRVACEALSYSQIAQPNSNRLKSNRNRSGIGPVDGSVVNWGAMQLRTARLCLDCEELHEQQVCPVCASEAFAFITRWVPVHVWSGPNRRRSNAVPSGQPPSSSTLKTWVVRGMAGAAVFGIGRMFLETLLASKDRSGATVPTRDRRAGAAPPAAPSSDAPDSSSGSSS